MGIAVAGGLDYLLDGDIGTGELGTTTGPGEIPAAELPEVTVEEWRGGGLSPVAATTLRVTRERLRLTVRCRGGDDGTTVTREVPSEDYEATQRVVAGVEPSSWSEEYPCEELCVTDDGMVGLAVTVDGRTHRTTVDPLRFSPEGAPLPTGIERVATHLESYWNRMPDPSPTECEF